MLSCLGGVLEFYDFIIFAFLAEFISNQIFPAENSIISLLATFGTYAVGYLARPIGGIVFGHFGDRYGRSRTFTASILSMALSTFGISIIPTYTQIGIFAPIILTILRLIQGFSVGGEIPGAITYISEKLHERRGFACGCVFFGINCGIIIAAAVVALLHTFLNDTQINLWGWRLPFCVGGILGLISFSYRKQLSDSLAFIQLEDSIQKRPLHSMLKTHSKEMFYGLSLIALAATVVTLFFVFIPAYLAKIVKYSATHFMWYYCAGTSLSACGNVLVGYYSDKVSHPALLFAFILSAIGFAYPIYHIYGHKHDLLYLAIIMSAIPSGIAFGLIPRLLADFFPTEIRYTGVATCYSFGFAIFGGLTPFLATLLIYRTQNIYSPAWIVILLGSITAFISCLKVNRAML